MLSNKTENKIEILVKMTQIDNHIQYKKIL